MEPMLQQHSCLQCNEPVGYLHRATCPLSGVVRSGDTDMTLHTGDLNVSTPATVASPLSLPEGWTVTRTDKLPFKSITVKSPDGKVAVLSSMGRNPENVFYEFADALLGGRDKL